MVGHDGRNDEAAVMSEVVMSEEVAAMNEVVPKEEDVMLRFQYDKQANVIVDMDDPIEKSRSARVAATAATLRNVGVSVLHDAATELATDVVHHLDTAAGRWGRQFLVEANIHREGDTYAVGFRHPLPLGIGRSIAEAYAVLIGDMLELSREITAALDAQAAKLRATSATIEAMASATKT